jgi:hypothetical protein
MPLERSVPNFQARASQRTNSSVLAYPLSCRIWTAMLQVLQAQVQSLAKAVPIVAVRASGGCVERNCATDTAHYERYIEALLSDTIKFGLA